MLREIGGSVPGKTISAVKKSGFIALFVFVSVYSALTDCRAQDLFTLQDCIVEKTDEKGRKYHAFRVEAIDYFLNKIAAHAKGWPPRFDSGRQRQEIEYDLRAIIALLEDIVASQPTNQDMLWRAGFACSMGYNLDFPQSAEGVEKHFKKLLSLDPEHPNGNLYYGAHLVGTAARQKESIPYLEKAVFLGSDEAVYMLGFAYIQLNDKEKALVYLRRYLEKYPQDPRVKMLIEAVEQGKAKSIRK